MEDITNEQFQDLTASIQRSAVHLETRDEEFTFVTSIPAYFILYAPVRDHPDYITGAGADPTASVALGVVLELVLIIANVGTAVVPYAVFRQYSEGLALGYVAARLVEAIIIAIGDHQPPPVPVDAARRYGWHQLHSRRSFRRDDSGVHLGVVVRCLPHRQGIQAVSDSGWARWRTCCTRRGFTVGRSSEGPSRSRW